MVKEIFLNGTKIQYDLQYKEVKNINVRIKPNGTVHVSANKRVSQKIIEGFVLSKAGFIQKALEKYENALAEPPKQYFSEDEICDVIIKLCEKVYPHFEKRGVEYPHIKFRKMVSRWGSCHPAKRILTFNTYLMYAPIECVEYVVVHEFTHFLQANHSNKFYEELAAVCPDWKACRKRLKEVCIR